jgi:hypothetical protein
LLFLIAVRGVAVRIFTRSKQNSTVRKNRERCRG